MKRWKRNENEEEINIDQIYNGEKNILKKRNKVKEIKVNNFSNSRYRWRKRKVQWEKLK